MHGPAFVLCVTAGATVALMLGVWALSAMQRDASIVDICWGLGFVVIAAIAWQLGGGHPGRAGLAAMLTLVWGLRLSLYLLRRNWGHGEDYRYQAMRKQYGERFVWVSLYLVFGLQGTLMWLISLPVQMAALSATPGSFTWLDGCGALLWAVGFAFEAIGDAQLARFKADPATRGKVMDRGLWRYTRHPNYFGDALLWWGLYLIGAATPAGRWMIFSPLLMTGLLMRVSGVPLLERKLVRTRPEYADYVRRTSSFVPWWPRR